MIFSQYGEIGEALCMAAALTAAKISGEVRMEIKGFEFFGLDIMVLENHQPILKALLCYI